MATDKQIEIPVNKNNGRDVNYTLCLHLDRFIYAEDSSVSAGCRIFYDEDGGNKPRIIESDVSLNQIISLADNTGYDHNLKKLTVKKMAGFTYNTPKQMVLNQKLFEALRDLNPGTEIRYRRQPDRNIPPIKIEVEESLCEPVISS